MPLEPVANLLADARRHGYAVGYFESWNLESLQGVIDAAEAVNAPIIIGFNGEFLSQPGRVFQERLALYAALGRAAADSATVPCSLIFNECPIDSWVMEAAERGFNIVMLADHSARYENYLARVKAVVEFAHKRNVAVEAELDALPSGASGRIEGDPTLTDPELSERFVKDSGVDLFAVSVGNIHIRTEGEQALDLDHLATLCDRIPVPLVLHGGSGIPSGSIREAIRLGVAKVNYGTYLKQRYLAALRAAVLTDEVNPHAMLGEGGKDDVIAAARAAVRDAVLERIDALGCAGRAKAVPGTRMQTGLPHANEKGGQ